MPHEADVENVCTGGEASIDEGILESRRRHELEELHRSHDLNKQKSLTLIVGSGFFGVEWNTKIRTRAGR